MNDPNRNSEIRDPQSSLGSHQANVDMYSHHCESGESPVRIKEYIIDLSHFGLNMLKSDCLDSMLEGLISLGVAGPIPMTWAIEAVIGGAGINLCVSLPYEIIAYEKDGEFYLRNNASDFTFDAQAAEAGEFEGAVLFKIVQQDLSKVASEL